MFLGERFAADQLSRVAGDNFGESGAFVVADYRDPLMVRLLTWPATLQALRKLGFTDPKLHNFYVSTKPPGASALSWHSDLFYPYERAEPAEVFLIYYLQDTSPENGCLRVVPGSHLWLAEQRHGQSVGIDSQPDEVAVTVRAGDVFVGDRRILHATHKNASSMWRTCLTIAYAPRYSSLPEPIQALIVQNRCLPPAGWWQQPDNYGIAPSLLPLLPVYTGTAGPIALSG